LDGTEKSVSRYADVIHTAKKRFLENQIRGKFDFVGTPIRFIQRLRTRRDKNSDTDN